jgi:hypothetical protein
VNNLAHDDNFSEDDGTRTRNYRTDSRLNATGGFLAKCLVFKPNTLAETA